MGIARWHQYTTKNTVYRGVPHVDDFVGLHLEDFIAFADGITLGLVPAGDGALDHFNAPLGHGDGINIAHYSAPDNALVKLTWL